MPLNLPLPMITILALPLCFALRKKTVISFFSSPFQCPPFFAFGAFPDQTIEEDEETESS